ncbi:MarR family transcriptional regulator [Eubacteriales bacterium OttesenSCG-928-N14]|nr:MarR family transcriptional regulator [Eubacteriales bacterium OttesenSCG-928-N14]
MHHKTHMEDSPAATMHQVNNAHRYWVQQKLSQMGLYMGQHFVLLGILYMEDNISQKQLADAVGVSPASMATSIKRMERNGLITRSSDENDMRRNQLQLTDLGKEYAIRCETIFAQADAQLLSGFSPEETEQLQEYLIRMRNNMGWRDWSPQHRQIMLKELRKRSKQKMEQQREDTKLD